MIRNNIVTKVTWLVNRVNQIVIRQCVGKIIQIDKKRSQK
jgi:hypothetical protein